MTKKPKKLPLATALTPAETQRGLAARPVGAGGSRPEFPTRSELYRRAGLLGGAALLAGGIAHAGAPARPAAPPPAQQAKPAPADKPVPPPAANPPAVDPARLANGSIDGQPLAAKAPRFKVYREGGGIGPAEDMWEPSDVEAFINWTMAKEGKLAIKTSYKLELDGLTLELDGFDPAKNVGYAYVDKFDGSREDFDKKVRARITEWMKAKKVAILFIDQRRAPDAATLKGKVLRFLAQVKKHPPAAAPLD